MSGDLYGKTFRILRKERGFTLKEMSKDIISYSYLSKFKKGESDMTMNNFIRLLERLNLTVDEFLYFSSSQRPSYVVLLNKVAVAYSQNNVDDLEKLYNEEKELYQDSGLNYHRCNYIMVAAIIKDLDSTFYIDPVDVDFYVDYLFNCSYWSTYEVSLFGNALTLFADETLVLLMNEIKTRLEDYKVSQRNIRDLLSLIENACLIFLRKGNIPEAKKLSAFLDSYMLPNYFLEKTRKLFIDGIILICEGHEKEGTGKARQAIDVLTIMDEQFAKDHEKELDHYLTNEIN